MQYPQPSLHRTLQAFAVMFFSILAADQVKAQISSGEGFLQGQYVEVGVNDCGVFGGNNAPLTALGPGPLGPWHPNVGAGLGFVADADQDGWDVGTPNRCGDYFVPGSPEESWALQVGTGTVYKNASLGCGTSAIPGGVTTYTDLGTARELVWEGNLTVGGLDIGIKQTTILPVDKLYFVTFVELTNNAATPVNNLYYGRSVDPDNEQPTSGDFTTNNTVLLQPPTHDDALVGALGLDFGCFLGLGARDTDARVAIGSDGTTFGMTSPYDIWNGGPGYDTLLGASITQDWSISLAFFIPEILSGECVSKGFAYILDTADLAEALDATTTVRILADSVDVTGVGTYTYCLGDTVRLEVQGDTTATWTWSPAAGLSDTVGQVVFAFPDSATTYTVSSGALGACGTGSAEVTIEVDSLYLNITAGPDEAICAGENVVLGASGAATYEWSPSVGLSDPNVFNPIAAPSSTRDYGVLGTTALGCTLRDTMTVVVNPLPLIFITGDTVICEGEETTLTANGGVSYQWTPSGLVTPDTAAVVSVGPSTSTTFFVTGTDANGCSNADAFDLTVFALSPPDAVADPSTIDITLDQTSTLSTVPSDYISYQWTPANGLLSDPTGATVTAQPLDTVLYYVMVTNEFGCQALDSVQLNVIGEYEVFLPTAFSPNGDGENDTYNPFIIGSALDRFMVNFSIYNRWGELVYSSADRFAGWDGSIGGQQQPIGTFVVVVRSLVKGEERIDRGTFTLVR